MNPRRQRLDREMVRRGLARSRSEAADLVARGLVRVAGSVAEKPSRLVSPSEPIALAQKRRRFVSRGGEKLEAALKVFGIDPRGATCLDVGSSTGGFVDCLLTYGAAKVYAVDVGKAQLSEKLRRDPRVVVLEGVDARDLDGSLVPERCSLVTVDVSFISCRSVVPATTVVAAPGATYVVLIKPQFEAGRDRVPKGGVIRDPAVHREVLCRVVSSLEESGLEFQGIVCSPVLGSEGNLEYLSCWRLKEPRP